MGSALDKVRALLECRIEACQAKDIDRLMSIYAPNIVYFDVVPPLHFTGSDAVRANFLRWFSEYEGPIGLETHELEIAISGDVAFAHMLHLDIGNVHLPKDQKFWLRSTVCCQRVDETWLITHEHISMPLEYKSPK
jgi:ketosteroid isomerase-like protein